MLCLVAMQLAVHAVLPPPREPLDSFRMAEAIAQAENTPNHVVGAASERSRWQITPDVWAKWSTHPFRLASSNRPTAKAETYRVVLRHIDHIRVRLAVNDLPDSPYLIGLAWCAGINATLTGSASPAKREHASRTRNLYEALSPLTD